MLEPEKQKRGIGLTAGLAAAQVALAPVETLPLPEVGYDRRAAFLEWIMSLPDGPEKDQRDVDNKKGFKKKLKKYLKPKVRDLARYPVMQVTEEAIENLIDFAEEKTAGQKEVEVGGLEGKERLIRLHLPENPSVNFLVTYTKHHDPNVRSIPIVAIQRIITKANGQVGMLDYNIRITGEGKIKLKRMISNNHPLRVVNDQGEAEDLLAELQRAVPLPEAAR